MRSRISSGAIFRGAYVWRDCTETPRSAATWFTDDPTIAVGFAIPHGRTSDVVGRRSAGRLLRCQLRIKPSHGDAHDVSSIGHHQVPVSGNNKDDKQKIDEAWKFTTGSESRHFASLTSVCG